MLKWMNIEKVNIMTLPIITVFREIYISHF